jgi:sugar/nucleoside kinase (ribokinase family)
MHKLATLEPVDYLIIGHLTQDITAEGLVLGGTATYSSLTALSLGLRAGIITACNPELDLSVLQGVQVSMVHSEHTTTFNNVNTASGRIQHITHPAPALNADMIPEVWRKTPVVHLGPIAQEVNPGLVSEFPHSKIGVTPQGWMRGWDDDGKIFFQKWADANAVLRSAHAAVFSIEDIQMDENYAEELADEISVLAITEGSNGARIYWNGDVRRFRQPQVYELDPTGAGDIFAAAFFFRYFQTRNPWEAGRFANHLATISVTQQGLDSIPSPKDVQENIIDIL